jgi:hypothetical protein
MTQAFCVIHILVSGKSPEHRLSQHSDESMPAVLAGACVGEYIAGHRGKAERGHSIQNNMLIMLAESRSLRRKLVRHPVDAGCTWWD